MIINGIEHKSIIVAKNQDKDGQSILGKIIAITDIEPSDYEKDNFYCCYPPADDPLIAIAEAIIAEGNGYRIPPEWVALLDAAYNQNGVKTFVHFDYNDTQAIGVPIGWNGGK